jgi:Fe2+ or Zn2+ uptake regulation protein
MSIEDELKLHFKKNKLRVSSKKILVAKQLTAYKNEVAAETLWIEMRERRFNISLSSVYQALNWMVELGFASRTIKGRKSLYEIKEASVPTK